MIAEAVDTATSIGWAIVAWIVLTSAAAVLALYTVVVAVWTVGRVTVRAALVACAWLRGRLSHEQPLPAPEPQPAPRRRPVPS
ncbi:hypothetical protein, partial [Streptomyces mirabilis]|uniref:hypothetical protein n=1 Tax=Streptomyces mirabilis TaxID=68239 RepID=UPI00340D0545